MINSKTTLKFVVLGSALFALVIVIGCGPSAEKQKISDFLKLYSDTVDEYSAANVEKRAEMKTKLDSFKSKWSNLMMEMSSELTPQDFQKMEKEYKEITEKYSSLVSHS
jgi:antirestriction protein